jgi:hypothetical protein
LTKLDKKHIIKGSKIPQYLEELKKNWPKLVSKYIRSKSLKDVLFKADYNYVKSFIICDIGISGSGTKEGKEQKDKEEDKEERGYCIHCNQSKIVRKGP